MTVTSLTYTMEGQTEPFHTADAAAIGENGVIGARASYKYSFRTQRSRQADLISMPN